MGERAEGAGTRDSQDAYPPSPAQLPPGWLDARWTYRARVVLVLLGLVTFVLGYAATIALLFRAFPAVWATPVHDDRYSIAFFCFVNFALGAMIVFLVKGLFHRRRAPVDKLIELTRAEQPTLFAFLDALARETGTPVPAHVYVDGSVNAAVFYERSLLALVWPVRKNLLIGLGLVNHLTRSELKAILGHELGHFGQRAMKVGTYVYVTHDIVNDLVQPDWFDEGLRKLGRTDIRIAFVTMSVLAITELMRGTLRVAFMVLAFGHRALMRDMELAADRVAVSIAGSDAIARGLYKAELADACAASTSRSLIVAGDHGLVTSDFFHHQARAIGDVRRQHRRPEWGDIAPDGPTRFLFAEDAISKPSMWATHPPSAERERAARRVFVASEHDERSAWTFFEDADALRERVTNTMRPVTLWGRKTRAPEDVERFLEAERARARALERFGEMFVGRPLRTLDLDAIFSAPSTETIEAELAAIPTQEIADKSKHLVVMRETAQLLQRARAGRVREEAVRIGGAAVKPEQIEPRLAALRREAAEIDARFEEIDEILVRVHAKMARALGEAQAASFREEIALVLRIQGPLVAQRHTRNAIGPALALMGSGGRLSASEARMFLGNMDALRNELVRVVQSSKNQSVPDVEGDLASFLLSRALPDERPNDEGVSLWISQVLQDAGEVADKLEQLHRKALAAMVVSFERIEREWRAQQAPRETA